MSKQLAAVLGTGQTKYVAKRHDVSMNGLVREAIDRGVPLEEVKKGNRITAELKKLIAPAPAKTAPAKAAAEPKLNLQLAR